MTRTTRLTTLILLVLPFLALSGCYHRPYYDGDSYAHGYGYGAGRSHYPGSSIYLHGFSGRRDYGHEGYRSRDRVYPRHTPYDRHDRSKHRSKLDRHRSETNRPGRHQDRYGISDRPRRHEGQRIERRRVEKKRHDRASGLQENQGRTVDRRSDRRQRRAERRQQADQAAQAGRDSRREATRSGRRQRAQD